MRPQKFAVLVMGSCLAAFASTQVGAQSASARNNDIEGVWMVTTTPRDCATGITFPQAAFANLLMFHAGGTMSASVPSSPMVIRTLGHGLWRHETGWSHYSFTFVHLRYDSSMAYTGRQVATGTLVLNANGNEFTTESRTGVFDTNGNPLGGGCGNSVGIRVELP